MIFPKYCYRSRSNTIKQRSKTNGEIGLFHLSMNDKAIVHNTTRSRCCRIKIPVDTRGRCEVTKGKAMRGRRWRGRLACVSPHWILLRD